MTTKLTFEKSQITARSAQLWQSDNRNYIVENRISLAPFLTADFIDAAPTLNPVGTEAALFFTLDSFLMIRGLLQYTGSQIVNPNNVVIANIPQSLFDSTLYSTSNTVVPSIATGKIYQLSLSPTADPIILQLSECSNAPMNLDTNDFIQLNYTLAPKF